MIDQREPRHGAGLGGRYGPTNGIDALPVRRHGRRESETHEIRGDPLHRLLRNWCDPPDGLIRPGCPPTAGGDRIAEASDRITGTARAQIATRTGTSSATDELGPAAVVVSVMNSWRCLTTAYQLQVLEPARAQTFAP